MPAKEAERHGWGGVGWKRGGVGGWMDGGEASQQSDDCPPQPLASPTQTTAPPPPSLHPPTHPPSEFASDCQAAKGRRHRAGPGRAATDLGLEGGAGLAEGTGVQARLGQPPPQVLHWDRARRGKERGEGEEEAEGGY